jgi:hypothetical protein
MWYAPAPEEPMADKILTALDEQRKQHVQQIATIDMARAIYVKGTGVKTVGKKRGKGKMSAATKRKLSIAAKIEMGREKEANRGLAIFPTDVSPSTQPHQPGRSSTHFPFCRRADDQPESRSAA